MAAPFKDAHPGFGPESTKKADVLGVLVAELQTRLGAAEDSVAGNVDIATNTAAIEQLQDEVEDASTGLLDRTTALETAKTTDEANIATNTTNITQLQGAGTKLVPISFAAGEVGTIKVYFPKKVTINKIRGFVTHAIAATDDGTVTAKDSSGGAMTSGVLTFTASSAFGFQPTAAVPSDHNVCLANDFIELVTAKTTPGGTGFAEVEYTVTP